MRRLPALVSAALVAAGMVAVPALATSPATPTAAPSGAPDVLHTGLLPNFTASGSSLVRLQAGAFDPLSDAAPSVSGVDLVDEAALDPAVAQPWLVQVRGQQFATARAAIAEAGATMLGNLPDDTYAVRATPTQAAVLATSDAVRWTGYLQPAWRIPVAAGEKPGLLELEGEQSYRVRGFRGDVVAESLGDALRDIDGVEVIEDAGVVVDVRATKDQVPAIAALPQVQWIGTVPVVVANNANARWVTDTGVRDLYAATAAGRLTGAGQTAAAADSGLNYTTDDNGHAHVAFRDCDSYPDGCELADYTMRASGGTEALMTDVVNNATDHRKMAAFFDLGGTGPSPQDPTAHGSHVSGSITADRGENGTWDGEDGLAPGARYVFQSIGTPTGGLAIPGDDYQLWRQAYRPRDPASVEEGHDPDDYADYIALEDARTHNNSYGLIVNLVDEGSAAAIDQFVWDHEDMVVVVSAGNEGPQPATIGSPSTAKNDLSSGASANGRQPMASIDSMASFSSHGPTADGRLGVDLATPGQTVISTKGGSEHDDHYLQGTSMSAPVLTGLATLVRQYFWDGYGAGGGDGMGAGAADLDRRHNPSAALVRASLVNGAVRMRGWYTGDDGSQREMDGQWPSFGQGFGLVNLDNSLFFTGDTMSNWYQDVWRDDGEAFDVGDVAATRSYTVDVQAGQPFDVTMSYTDAPTLLPAGTSALTNNLDLVVTGPSGTFVGNNTNSRQDGTVDEATSNPGPAPLDTVNPTERVRIADPDPGTYTITVRAGLITEGPQGFALAASGLLSDAGAPGTFDPGPPLQINAPGDPVIDPGSIEVETFSADTAEIRFRTNEPTTARAVLSVEGSEATFTDVYNQADDSPFTAHYRTGPVETSAEYADRPVVSDQHEILVYGLSPGTSYDVELVVEDLADPPDTGTAETTIDSPNNRYQPYADDIGQLAGPNATGIPPDPIGAATWQTGTQLYAGVSGGGLLGAFMFRLPAGVDPDSITGAAVELTGMHVSSSLYNADHRTYVDLLPEEYEPDWGTQDYEQIHNAPSEARAEPETAVRIGAGVRHAFTFPCDGLAALRQTLGTQDEATGERLAAFRVDGEVLSENSSIPSYEFGFNRRSRGPELRPRLVLFTGDQSTNLTRRCDEDAPAPTISEVGIAPALEDDAVTVSWRTDRVGDSLVLVREHGAEEWTQVGTPMLTTSHQVQVRGLDAGRDYEIAVRSTGCNGESTTDDNGGLGYEPFLEQGRPDIPATEVEEHGSFDFDDGPQGWTVEDEGEGFEGTGFNTSNWAHDPEGGPDGSGAMEVRPYTNGSRSTLTAPEPITFGEGEPQVRFDAFVDVEPDFDYLYLEHSIDGGAWVQDIALSRDDGTWQEEFVVLEDVEPDDEVVVRFVFDSDELVDSDSDGYEGVAVDNVVIGTGINTVPGVPADERHQVPPDHAPPAEGDGVDADDVPTRRIPTPADLAAGTGYCPDGVPEGVFASATDVLEGDTGETPLTFTVHLPAGAAEAVTVHYETVAGTATADDDFVPQSGDLTFEPGDTAKTVVVPVLGDGLAENDETVTLRLSEPEGTSLLEPEATATILDDDGRGASCPAGRVPSSGLDDIEDNTHESAIECIAWYGITLGLGDVDGDGRVEYGPDGSVTRGQMASFIARLGLEAGLDLPDDASNAFDDDDGTEHEANIDALAALQLVRGRPDSGDVDGDGDRAELQFFPDEPVSRAQMASFIARLHEAAHEPFPSPATSHFGDDDGNVHEGNIDRLAEAGVVQGRPDASGELRYFPDEAVSRAQMASFIARELGLLVKAGVARVGGADVVLDSDEVAAGEPVGGRVETAKELLALQVAGCGLDAESVNVDDDGTFSVTVPNSRPAGPCTLVFTATTRRSSPLEPNPPAQTVDIEVPITVT